MPHKPLTPFLFSLGMALVLVMLSLPADSSAQEILQPYAPPILHAFLDSANVYPESVTADQTTTPNPVVSFRSSIIVCALARLS